MLLGVGRGPSDDLAGLGLAVAIEHGHPETGGEPAGLERGERRGDRAHIAQRRQRLDGCVVAEHRHRGRCQHCRADLVTPDQRGEVRRVESVHHHQRGAGPKAEQSVVDACVERHRNRYEVRGRRSGPGSGLGSQRLEDPVDDLEVSVMSARHRFRASSRTRGPLHDRRPRRRGEGGHRSYGVVDDGPGLARVDRHEDRTGAPAREHRDQRVDAVGDDGRGLPRPHVQFRGLGLDPVDDLSLGQRCIQRVDQWIAVLEGMLDEQPQQAHRPGAVSGAITETASRGRGARRRPAVPRPGRDGPTSTPDGGRPACRRR